jgi:hypothetical protein
MGALWCALIFSMGPASLVSRMCSTHTSTVVHRLPRARLAGIATVFHPGDGHGGGGTLGCVSESRRLLGTDQMRDDLPIVAMRDGLGVACGESVYVENPRNGLRTLAIRASSGPFGMRCGDTRIVALDGRLKPGCTWLGVVDLSPRVAREINLPGRGRIRRGEVKLRWW